MCGIIAVVRRPPTGEPPDLAPLLAELDAVVARLAVAGVDRDAGALRDAAVAVQTVSRTLRGPLGAGALIAEPVSSAAFEHRATELAERLVAIEAALDSAAGDATEDADDIEARNAALVACKDAVWALQWDRLAAARAIEGLAARGSLGRGALAGYHSIQVALSALDRLEVRGRDSAGLHVLVAGHDLDLDDVDVARMIAERASDTLFTSGSVRIADGHLAFVYKTAAEIGELGDNTARLHAQIQADDLLRVALRSENARTAVLSHTRWASIGIISEPNAHPLNQEEIGSVGPYVIAALNGDVDNYADLKALESLRLPPEITTDAKVIPALVSRRIASGVESTEAFRSTVASFEGSVAIGAIAGANPDQVLLALRGSGQALYVGLGNDCFVVASEPYGVVEECDRYMRLDGETMLETGNPASQGQIVVIDAREAGSISGIRRQSYDGRALPVVDAELQTPEITTRDVARGDAAHYLLKEMAESPDSFRKTFRGRIVDRDGRLDVRLPAETFTPVVLERLRSGTVQRVLVIGQGSAHVAGQSLAHVFREALASRPVPVEALTATELSGFELAADMSDAIVVAISQSGTTTDTNRTVDLARARGAVVVAIVNRRQSDLVDKSDGVLYTSDGRDVEMSVASTKAFYAQLAAGVLLALGLATELGVDTVPDRAHRSELLSALRELPDAMREVFERRPVIALAAQRHTLSRRSWAIVGNGVNQTAAHELRIKLSELCYKAIACDVTEDKKHIDLSSEPMILVCAAGLHGSNADDVAKEVAIYRAHKAAPIVIADDDETRFESAAAEMIPVPTVNSSLAFVLCALAGHLFGYEAALAIDASARPLREARGCIEALVGSVVAVDDDPLAALVTDLEPLSHRFFDGLRAGNYDGSLEARTAVQLASMLRYAMGVVPLDAYQVEFGKVGTPSVVIQDLTDALTKAIEELTRPVDAIKHQAKTVTVGISRSDETLLQVRLVREVLASGTARDSLNYKALRTLVALDGAVESVIGWTRYRIDGDPARGPATVRVVDRGGIARDIPSRTAESPALRGTKHRVATEREVTVARGYDQRTLIHVPEVKGNQTTGITLLHVRILDRLAANATRRVLEGYHDRYQAIVDQVTEFEPVIRDDVLGRIGLVELLTEPVVRLADHWKQSARARMQPVLTPLEMTAADQHAIATGTPEGVLVERAGTAVARHAVRMLGGTYGRRVAIVCGKGNNGADGRVAARHLRAWGVGADELLLAAGFAEHEIARVLARADLVVDAMYGTGFRGRLDGDAARGAREMRASGARVLAVDIPSGVDGATGRASDDAVRADETICFAAYKPGLLFEPGSALAGRVVVVDIGIDVGDPRLVVLDGADLALPSPDAESHKWSSGCLVVGGSSGMVGAPLLAGTAALRCGAGMVVCAVPGASAAAQVSGRELVARALPATPAGALDEDAARVVLEDVARFRALAIGPGLGRDERTQAAVRRIVARAAVPIVIDADALNAIAADPSALLARDAAGLPPAVLTPHGGEYERLAGRPVGDDRVSAARELAARLHAIVLLKGPGTVIAAPDGRAIVNRTGGPALATAGTGDVLTGVIVGLLAQGIEPYVGAATGAYVHGRAADAAPTSPDIVASDLVSALPRTLQALRGGADPWEK